jgi:hypothetical protein
MTGILTGENTQEEYRKMNVLMLHTLLAFLSSRVHTAVSSSYNPLPYSKLSRIPMRCYLTNIRGIRDAKVESFFKMKIKKDNCEI